MGRPALAPGKHSALSQRVQVKHLNATHKQIALMVAQGMRTKDIAFALGMQVARISTIKHSPLMIPLIEKHRKVIEAQALAMTAQLQHEFEGAIETISDLAESAEEESVQLAAAKFLAEKAIDVTIPKKSQVESTQKIAVFNFDADTVKMLQNVMAEDITDAEVVP